MPDPTPMPESSWLSRWLDRQSPAIKALLAAVLGAVVTTLSQWVAPVLHPPAGMTPDQQQTLSVAAKRGEIVADVLGGTFPELVDPTK